MSNDLAKFINSKRRHKTDVAIARQVKIAKSHGTFNQANNSTRKAIVPKRGSNSRHTFKWFNNKGR